MSEGSEWRSGAAAYALALAGYWVLPSPPPSVLPAAREGILRRAAGDLLDGLPAEPLLIVEGTLDVYDDPVGRKETRLRRLGPGEVLVPIGSFVTRPGVRLKAGEGCALATIPYAELVRRSLEDEECARLLVEGLTRALEKQAWVLRLSAAESPLARLVTLLVRIAEDVGVEQPEGILLRGAPDARELSVLAGVSRESVVINLAWLEHEGLLRREGGRLWAPDLPALREAGVETR